MNYNINNYRPLKLDFTQLDKNKNLKYTAEKDQEDKTEKKSDKPYAKKLDPNILNNYLNNIGEYNLSIVNKDTIKVYYKNSEEQIQEKLKNVEVLISTDHVEEAIKILEELGINYTYTNDGQNAIIQYKYKNIAYMTNIFLKNDNANIDEIKRLLENKQINEAKTMLKELGINYTEETLPNPNDNYSVLNFEYQNNKYEYIYNISQNDKRIDDIIQNIKTLIEKQHVINAKNLLNNLGIKYEETIDIHTFQTSLKFEYKGQTYTFEYNIITSTEKENKDLEIELVNNLLNENKIDEAKNILKNILKIPYEEKTLPQPNDNLAKISFEYDGQQYEHIYNIDSNQERVKNRIKDILNFVHNKQYDKALNILNDLGIVYKDKAVDNNSDYREISFTYNGENYSFQYNARLT